MQKEQADKLRVILGKNLAATRKGLRYTQAQGAKLIGCDENLLSQWETGQRFPSLPYLVRIATVYDVNLNYLFGLCVDVAPDIDSSRTGAMMYMLNAVAERFNKTLAAGILKQSRRVLPDCETGALLDQISRLFNVIQKSSANLDDPTQIELHTLKHVSQQVMLRQEHRLRMMDRAIQDAIEHDDRTQVGHLGLWEGLEEGK